MHEMLFTKNEISSSIHFWNVDHNNGRKQNIVQKKAVKASKAYGKKSSAFKRKTFPYQVRRDLLYYHRWTHLQKYFVITKIILLILWITLYSPVEPSTAQYIPVQSGTFQYCPVQPSTAQEVNWFSDTVEYSWNIEQLLSVIDRQRQRRLEIFLSVIWVLFVFCKVAHVHLVLFRFLHHQKILLQPIQCNVHHEALEWPETLDQLGERCR